MELTIRERLLVPTMLPREGNRLTIRSLKEINEKLGFSADELEKYTMSITDEGIITYKDNGDTFDIDMTLPELKIVCDNYLKLDSEGKLNTELFNIGERIFDLVNEG